MAMSDDTLRAFLGATAPVLVGVIGTLGADGSPHVVPVWYRWDGASAHVWSDEKRVWVRNLLGDPRVAFSVQEMGPPYVAVVMRGRAEVTTSDEVAVSDEIRRITRRYIEPDDVEEYIAGWSTLRTIVTIRPEAISSWGRGY